MTLDKGLDKILIIDFGSQFTQLIARRIREFGVFSEIISHKKIKNKDINEKIKGIILSGGPLNVYDIKKYSFDKNIIENEIPVLGICFGHQFIAHIFGGAVDYLWSKSKKKGVRKVKIFENNSLIPRTEDLLIYSHQEGVVSCPPNFQVSASSGMVEIEGLVHKNLPIWTFQPHVESSKEFAERLGISSQQFTKTIPCSSLILSSFLNKLKNS